MISTNIQTQLLSNIQKLKVKLKSDFIRNASTLMSGSLVSQIIPFLFAPIISRLYYPEDYAVVAAYTSVTILLTIIATGMYSSALMLDKSDEKAINTGVAALFVTMIVTLLSLLTVLLLRNTIAVITGNQNVAFWLYFIPLTVLFTGSYQTIYMWNNRKKRYKRIASNRIFQTIITSSITILLGFLGYHQIGLLVSLFAGQIFAFTLLFLQTIRNDSQVILKTRLTSVKESFVQHKDFPKFNMPQGFLDGVRESSIVIIISNFFGAGILGSYSFAMSILNKPIQFVATSISQVYYQRASERFNNGQKIWGVTKKILLGLSIVTIPLFIFLLIGGQQLFIILFGRKWAQAGKFVQILSLWILVKFIASSISVVPLILNQQKKYLLLSIYYNIIPPIALGLFSIIVHRFELVLLGFSVTNIIVLLYMTYWIYKICNRR